MSEHSTPDEPSGPPSEPTIPPPPSGEQSPGQYGPGPAGGEHGQGPAGGEYARTQPAPTGDPGYGPPPSGDPGYGPPPSGDPSYGQPPPGNPGYGQPPPNAGYGQPTPVGYGQPGVAVAPAGLYHDQESGLYLPQGVQLASAGRRIGAYFLAIPLSIITLGIGYIIWGAIVWANGQTPALQVLGMRCWRPETGRVAGWWWMALREIVGRLVDGILGPITGIISFVLMLVNRDRKSLHDLVAGTVVIHDPNKVLKV